VGIITIVTVYFTKFQSINFNEKWQSLAVKMYFKKTLPEGVQPWGLL